MPLAGAAFRPLMLTSALPEVAEARGVSRRVSSTTPHHQEALQ